MKRTCTLYFQQFVTRVLGDEDVHSSVSVMGGEHVTLSPVPVIAMRGTRAQHVTNVSFNWLISVTWDFNGLLFDKNCLLHGPTQDDLKVTDITKTFPSNKQIIFSALNIKVRSFRNSGHINEKWDGPYRGFSYLSLFTT